MSASTWRTYRVSHASKPVGVQATGAPVAACARGQVMPNHRRFRAAAGSPSPGTLTIRPMHQGSLKAVRFAAQVSQASAGVLLEESLVVTIRSGCVRFQGPPPPPIGALNQT